VATELCVATEIHVVDEFDIFDEFYDRFYVLMSFMWFMSVVCRMRF